jgi:hypothetical protein
MNLESMALATAPTAPAPRLENAVFQRFIGGVTNGPFPHNLESETPLPLHVGDRQELLHALEFGHVSTRLDGIQDIRSPLATPLRPQHQRHRHETVLWRFHRQRNNLIAEPAHVERPGQGGRRDRSQNRHRLILPQPDGDGTTGGTAAVAVFPVSGAWLPSRGGLPRLAHLQRPAEQPRLPARPREEPSSASPPHPRAGP